MKRNELEISLNKALVGKEIDYNMRLCDMAKPLIEELFDNSRGYYSCRVDNYTLTITYKRYRLCECNVKRQKVNGKMVIKAVEVWCEFDNTDMAEQRIHNEYKDELTRPYFMAVEKQSYDTLTKIFEAVKENVGTENMADLQSAVHSLDLNFWLIEDTING